RLWVGTATSGLNRFDRKTKKFIRYKHAQNNPVSISHDSVMSLCNDGQFLWVGTIHGGLNRLNKETGNFSRFFNDPKATDVNKTMAIEEIFIDRSNILWVCSRPGVILKHDQKIKGFSLYRHDPTVKGTISSNTILPIYEDKQGTIWIGTGNAGLNQYLRSTDSFVTYKFDPKDTTSLPAPAVFAMAEDNKGTFWVSASDTSKGTLSILDRKTGKFIKFYRHDPKNPDSISNNRFLLDIYPDRFSPNILWLATAFGGLEKFDTKNEIFKHYPGSPGDPGKLSGSYLNIFQDDAGMLWLGGNYGLDRFDPSSEKVKRYRNIPDKSNSLIENNVSVIHEDHTGNLWLGTTGGLDKFNPKTQMFTHYTTKDGLPDNNILGMLEDDHGNLWMSSGSGIIKFDPNKEEFKLYTKSDGLQGDAFYWFSDCRTRDGEMWFAGFNGANRFYPDKIKDNPHIPNIALTSVKQGGEEIASKVLPSRLKRIVLDWRTNYFEFEAAALEFTAPEKNKYMYMLEGFDDKWFDAGNRRFGRYSNIPGGTYTLKIKGSNNDGVWNENSIAVQVIVANPPWKTWWAYALYFIAASTLLFGFIKSNTIKVKKEEKIAEGLRRSNEILNKEIIERKQAENDLLESENKYRDLIDSAPDLRYRTDIDGRIVFASQSVFGLSGYTVEESIGMKMAEEIYVNPEERESFLQILQKNGIITNFEAQLKHKDGSTWWASTNAQISKDTAGNIIGVEGVTRDITERKLAEEKLSLQSGIITLMSEGVFMVNEDSIIVYTNPAFEKMFGYDSDEMIGFHVSSLNAPTEKSPEETAEEILKALNDTGTWIGEIQNIKKDGTSFWSSANVTVLDHLKYGKAFISVQTDITELKQAKNEKTKLEIKLQQAQKMESIGSLAGGIAHDFNNLLFPIIGMSEMLLEDLPDDSLEYENAEEIFHAGKRAGDLVQQILAFSRQSEHKMSPVRVQSVLKEVLKLSRSTIPTNIEIQQKIQQNCGLVMADPTQIHQIGMNLITNAFHAVESKNGIINIELKETTLKENELSDSELQPGQYIKLSVSDDGTGMSENTIQKIFEPYFTTKEQGKGTGLGLAVIYGIVKEHKGEIKVYSEVGKGTTFNVYLPLMKRSSEETSVDNVAKAETGTERILLVDDEVSVAKLESQMLSRLGYHLTVKTNSEDALNAFKSNPNSYDLVISDMTMPNMTGDQLAKELLSIKAGIPIIICTGFSERINKEQAVAIGVKGFLMKPVIKSDMAQMVRKVLDEAKIS
ncbi:MAG: PAS domain S-box protein, partial [Desulfobacteraceae bacterium]|nr:PAS domain S-box protein [Desulfobacteraceae bacterium]